MSTFIERPTKWTGFMPVLIAAAGNGIDEANVLLRQIAEELDKHAEADVHGKARALVERADAIPTTADSEGEPLEFVVTVPGPEWEALVKAVSDDTTN